MDIGLAGKAIAGVLLGAGLIWLIWRKITQGEARAVENAGRKAAQEIEAEAQAAEAAIRKKAQAKHEQAGPVNPNDWKFSLLIGALGLLCIVAGCTDVKAFGVSRWPMIEVPLPAEYTADEQAALAQFSTEHPALARKIVNQGQALRSAVDEYNQRAWDVNAKQLKTLGYTDIETIRLLGERPKSM